MKRSPSSIPLPWLTALAAFLLVGGNAIAQDLPLGGLRSFEGISVGMADRAEASRITDAGVVSVAGASGMVVTVAGELKGRADRDGTIGLLLLPEVPFFDSLYRSRGRILTAAEVLTPIAAGSSSHFIGKSQRIDIGFPSYRLLLFNTTGASASVNVYVYPARN